MGGLGSDRGEMPFNADVNVTSLVDVMLVLLIIFMITAPMMQGGVDVELPRAEARPLSPKEGMVVRSTATGAFCRPDTGLLQRFSCDVPLDW